MSPWLSPALRGVFDRKRPKAVDSGMVGEDNNILAGSPGRSLSGQSGGIAPGPKKARATKGDDIPAMSARGAIG